MTRIAFVGQAYWVRHLAELVNRHGARAVRAIAAPLPGLTLGAALPAVTRADILVRVGFRPGARTRRGVLFDAAWHSTRLVNPRAKRFCYWIGSDVLHALEDAHDDERSSGIRLRRSRGMRHIAGAPWLAEELRSVGIVAQPVLFPTALPNFGSPEALASEFRVLTYVPDPRPSFYSAEAIQALARRLPSVGIDVIGGLGAWHDGTCPNLVFHGWQSDVSRFFDRSTVVVRLVRHDAIGGSVREGLASGRHVVYSYPLPHTHFVSYGDTEGLIATVSQLADEHTRGILQPNLAGRAFALAEFNEEALTRRLVDVLLA